MDTIEKAKKAWSEKKGDLPMSAHAYINELAEAAFVSGYMAALDEQENEPGLNQD